MWVAISLIILAFLFIIGGMMTLLKSKNFKLPKDYDSSKSGYDDDDDDDDSSNGF